jgi:holo-[acyl-carrier protein] synthase
MTVGSPLSALQSAWQACTAHPDGQAAGVGIDLVEVEPLRRLVQSGGAAFLDTAWTPREQHDANGQPEGLARKWAAKEAVMKTLQRGIGDLDPLDIEIVTTDAGAPGVKLHRAARAAAWHKEIGQWHLSVTHEGGWAAAIAIALPRLPQRAGATITSPAGDLHG